MEIVVVIVVFFGVFGMLILLKLFRLVFIEVSVFCIDLWNVWLMDIVLFIDFIVVVRFGFEFGNFLKVKCGILVMI